MKQCAICGKEVDCGVVAHKDCLPRWIDVNVWLPPELPGEGEYRCLIVHHRFNDIRPMFSGVGVARFKGGRFWSDAPAIYGCPLLVTHWMPLPDLPEEGK